MIVEGGNRGGRVEERARSGCGGLTEREASSAQGLRAYRG
jgi:hypothetical protein